MTQNYTPRQIVAELDKYIVGQHDAKKAVAISLRNRYRREQVAEPLKSEIIPKNILAVGPTGVGKTEIARRLAKLTDAPFIKVEATKFTEVGYVGRDVESIVRDLMEISLKIIKDKEKKKNIIESQKIAKVKVISILVGKDASEETRKKFSKMLEEGKLDQKEIEIKVLENSSPISSFDFPGGNMGMINLGDVLGKVGGDKKKTVKLPVDKALKILIEEESNNLMDEEKINSEAVHLAENEGIIFIDEIDKICAKHNRGGEVSREGVQRDLLPLVEGCNVSTKYGSIKTDHILFIASGAFHEAKPSDLLPELQGRFPIRVQLHDLKEADLVKILEEPENSLIKQYKALMEIETNIELNFKDSGIKQIAKISHTVNQEVENIGARRLHTLLEKILEEVSFESPDFKKKTIVNIDQKYVDDHVGDLALGKIDLSKFIL
jgi:ATP-dependent HslUV protease ATP-binding subunit HslU